ncbi:MAG TPA: proline racemase family protein [Acidobacteriaceae bacterium]
MNANWRKSSLACFDALPGERIVTIDMHTAGEPLRIILDAPFFPQGADILARRRDASESHWDHFRRVLMFEPRGHADMYGAIITAPVTPKASFGVLFMHNEGYSTMCGHAIIALGKAAVELGWVQGVEPETVVHIDAPAGLVTARVNVREGRVLSTRFANVPSFSAALDQTVTVPGLGDVPFDVGYGGAYYAFVDAASIGLRLDLAHGRDLAAAGIAIKRAVIDALPIRHPEFADLGFLYGTIFFGPAADPRHHSRHVCVFADGAIDRSPTGTGVSARLALLHVRREIVAGERIAIESITGEMFGGRVLEALVYHGIPAVIPEVEGTAHFTGCYTFLVEPGDPLAQGFLVR